MDQELRCTFIYPAGSPRGFQLFKGNRAPSLRIVPWYNMPWEEALLPLGEPVSLTLPLGQPVSLTIKDTNHIHPSSPPPLEKPESSRRRTLEDYSKASGRKGPDTKPGIKRICQLWA
ncbi:hypothetical protein SUGI_1373690 [Cryptomeria japonica]|uniref:Uncharacterized protein n=1 Tax=Cryptomeria japonica TaxID=3369 RepID=A0AAD3NU60_CRYJA|nr:hypothetical protein SUGI_1373690 [Cryptomeria japonica]